MSFWDLLEKAEIKPKKTQERKQPKQERYTEKKEGYIEYFCKECNSIKKVRLKPNIIAQIDGYYDIFDEINDLVQSVH